MTIPKFRVWEPYYKKMFANDQIIVWNGNVYVNDTDKITVDNIRGWSIDDKYLMQYTGIKDRNGIEIFEGDIVHAYSEYTYLTGVVEYFDNAYCIKNKDGSYNSLWVNAEHYEVIGNIYEHQDLVEE